VLGGVLDEKGVEVEGVGKEEISAQQGMGRG
jgi:hypothetical protein